MLSYFRSTMAKVLRRVALLHRALHNEDKTSSCSKAVEVKDPSSDSVHSSLRTTGVPRYRHVRSLTFALGKRIRDASR